MGRGSAEARLRGMGRGSAREKFSGMGIKGGQKSTFFMNTIYCYYFPFKDNLGIIFPKFEVSSVFRLGCRGWFENESAHFILGGNL